MSCLKLSYSLDVNSPVHVGLKKTDIIHNSQISKGDAYNSYLLTIENHSGTHVDAPGHLLEDGKIISDYSPEELIFKDPLILDIPKNENELVELQDVMDINLNDVDSLLFCTGFEKFREDYPEDYLTQNPGISPEVIYWIREKFPNVRCLGIDCISISSYQNPEIGTEAHLNAFRKNKKLSEPLLLIEDMKLDDIKNKDLKWLMVVPWQIKGVDSAPCTVLADIID